MAILGLYKGYVGCYSALCALYSGFIGVILG